MMEQREYKALRSMSAGLFKNSLVLPVSRAILQRDGGSPFTATNLCEGLGGRVASNQIRDALSRLEASGAIEQLPFPGRPHPRSWERRDHSFWSFVEDWAAEIGRTATQK
jgi:hypothetical protein